MALIQGAGEDPMTALAPLVRSPESPDAFRIEMIRRWLGRRKVPRATRAAAFFVDPAMKSQADLLLNPPK